MSKAHDEVISEILVELDKEYAEYQRLFKKFHGEVDMEAKRIYDMKVSLCEEFRKRISAKEGRETR
jgi:hypothetical protein